MNKDVPKEQNNVKAVTYTAAVEHRNYDLEESKNFDNVTTQYKQKYKEFYSDIKIDTTEDW